MRLVYDRSPEVARFVAERFGGAYAQRGFGTCKAIGVERAGKLIGGVVFNNYDPERGEIELTAHGDPGWCDRRIMKAVAAYLDAIQVKTLIAWTDTTNSTVRGLLKHCGATEYPVKELGRVLIVLPVERWLKSPARGPNGLDTKSAGACRSQRDGGGAEFDKHCGFGRQPGGRAH